jgi:uncharacterized protein (TIGR02246 family)
VAYELADVVGVPISEAAALAWAELSPPGSDLTMLRRIDVKRREALVTLGIMATAAWGCTQWSSDRARGEDMDAANAFAEIVAALTAAWNRHDMEAFAALFHEDATFVNIRGTLWKGRDAIRDVHKQIHSTFYRASQVAQEVEDVRVLAPTVALGHIRSDLSGDERFPDTVKHTQMTLVILEMNGRWLIAEGHNTEIAPLPSSPQPR